MSAELVFTGARLVLPDRLLDGGLSVRDGRIAALDEGPSGAPGALDLEGDYLLPGLVELHSDSAERHLMPRPSVLWPSPLAAYVSHDLQVIGAGITTVLDAIALGGYGERAHRHKLLGLSLEALEEGRRHGLLRARHGLHLRAEVADPHVVELFAPLAEHPLARLASLMDHTPGQRQFVSMDAYATYNKGKYGFTDDELAAHVVKKHEAQALYAAPNRRRVLASACRRYPLPE